MFVENIIIEGNNLLLIPSYISFVILSLIMKAWTKTISLNPNFGQWEALVTVQRTVYHSVYCITFCTFSKDILDLWGQGGRKVHFVRGRSLVHASAAPLSHSEVSSSGRATQSYNCHDPSAATPLSVFSFLWMWLPPSVYVCVSLYLLPHLFLFHLFLPVFFSLFSILSISAHVSLTFPLFPPLISSSLQIFHISLFSPIPQYRSTSYLNPWVSFFLSPNSSNLIFLMLSRFPF